eukprot:NODE_434_length_7483_cov_0.351165.p3 type:complete len:268 gc:universal NODE_434_length_7483_cov_0.351165:6027-6830(+)
MHMLLEMLLTGGCCILFNVVCILYTIKYLKINSKPTRIALFIFSSAILTHISMICFIYIPLLSLVTAITYFSVVMGVGYAYKTRLISLGVSTTKLEQFTVKYTMFVFFICVLGVSIAGSFRFLNLFGDLYMYLSFAFLIANISWEILLFIVLIRKVDFYFEYRRSLQSLLLRKSTIYFIILIISLILSIIFNILYGTGPDKLIEGHLRTWTYSLRSIILVDFYKDIKLRFHQNEHSLRFATLEYLKSYHSQIDSQIDSRIELSIVEQ